MDVYIAINTRSYHYILVVEVYDEVDKFLQYTELSCRICILSHDLFSARIL